MTLIKAAHSDRMLNDAVVLDFQDLARQADALMESARRKARDIMERANAQAAEMIAGADARGFEQGHVRGLAEGHQKGEQAARTEVLASMRDELQALTDGWTEALHDWERNRTEMLQGAREDVLRLGIELGRRVAHRLVESAPTAVCDQVAHVLGLLAHPSRIAIHVHPSDVAVVRDILPELTRLLSTVEHATVIEDEGVSRGGCIVRTRRGCIDATIEKQLDRIAQTLVPNVEMAVNDGVEGSSSS